VFPARYELNSYIVFRKRLVSKRLIMSVSKKRSEKRSSQYIICTEDLGSVDATCC
jgi:hypothetical protein